MVGRTLVVILLSLLVQESKGAGKALHKAIKEARKEAIEHNLELLIRNGDGASARAVLDSHSHSETVLAKFRAELKKAEEEADKHKVRYNEKGQFIGGDGFKHGMALERAKTLKINIAILEEWTPRILGSVGRFKSDKATDALIEAVGSTRHWYARAQAARGLGTIGTEKALAGLIDCLLKEAEPGVKVGIIDALSPHAKTDFDCRNVIGDFLQDTWWQVRSSAAQALARYGDRDQVKKLIDACKGAEGRLRNEYNQALVALTGVDKHGDHGAWKAWWEFNGEKFLRGEYKAHPSDRKDRKGVSTFYGIPILSDNIVFCIDISQSMVEKTGWFPEDPGGDEPEGDRRIDVAKFELKRIIRSLSSRVKFDIVVFDRNSITCFEKPMKADRRGKKKAEVFVDGIETGDGTGTWGALEQSFIYAGGEFYDDKLVRRGTDSVYLLTDGMPTVGTRNPEDFLERFENVNRFKKVKIHSIAIRPSPGGKRILKGMSDMTGGTYVER